MFWYGTQLCNNCHKVMIALPPGNEMEMQVIGNTCPCRLPDITANINAVTGEVVIKECGTFLQHCHKSGCLFLGKFRKTGDVSAGCHEKMTVCIGKSIKQNNGLHITIEQKLIFIKPLCPRRFEKTTISLGCFTQDMVHSPGRP